MKNIQIIATIILIISLTSAVTIIAGSDYTLEFSGEVSECYIFNNKSNLEGLNFTENGSNVIIKTVQNYKPDNFTISCMVKMTREERQGGSARKSYEKSQETYVLENTTLHPTDTNLPEVVEPKTTITEIMYEKDIIFNIWHPIIAIISLIILVWIIRIMQVRRLHPI